MKRTEDFFLSFRDGLVEGWTFGVTEAFRDQLDILYVQYVDKEKSQKLRKQQPRGADGKLPTVFRMGWGRGAPPVLSFGKGQIFYDPPAARGMVWSDALKILRRSAQITEAKPDAPSESGWVKFVLAYYDAGQAIRTERHAQSQAAFEQFLRTGQIDPHAEGDSRE